MTDLNNLCLIGRVVRDVAGDERSFSFLPNGTAKASVSIAVNRSKKQGDQWTDEVSYFDVTIFGKQAENLREYLKKGTQICVEGYLKQDRWEKDGQKFSRVGIIANTVHLLGSKSSEKSQGNSVNTVTSYNENAAGDGFPEDVPF